MWNERVPVLCVVKGEFWSDAMNDNSYSSILLMEQVNPCTWRELQALICSYLEGRYAYHRVNE